MSRLRALILLASLLTPLVTPSTVIAVTYGDSAIDQSQFPEVVGIYAWDEDDGTYSSACTGTLISQTEVLTAAHCVRNRDHLLVNVGAVTEDDWNPVGVIASWYSSRYSESRFANDIGLLKLVRDAGVPRVAKIAKSFTPRRSTRYVLAGFGVDQNKDARGLRYATLVPQDAAARRYFGSGFNPRTTLGAGRFIRAEGVYAGACNGDSGGPLFLRSSTNVRTVVGVVSYGARDCDDRVPTVFSRVSYYRKMIDDGRRFLSARTVSPPAPLSIAATRTNSQYVLEYSLNATTADGFFIRSFCVKVNGAAATGSQVTGDGYLIPYSIQDGCFYNSSSYELTGGRIVLLSSIRGATIEITAMDELRRTASTSLTAG